jgi:hypothetical protein
MGTSDVTGAPSLTTDATTLSDAGTYSITSANGDLTSGNYAFQYENGTLTIGKATITVRADDKSRIYGDANPTFTATYNGWKNGQDLASSDVKGTPSLTTEASELTGVGRYTIASANGDLSSVNYAFQFENGTLTIGKSIITVIADNKSRIYGDANPTFTATYNGWKNGQEFASSDVKGSPSLTTIANALSDIGTYTIQSAVGDLASDNYAFQFTDGTLTIGKATVTVRADDKSRIYGDANPTFTATYNGWKNGQSLGTSDVKGAPGLTTEATELTDAGTYTISTAIGSLVSGNYAFQLENGSLTIGKATVMVTADDKSRIYGDV